MKRILILLDNNFTNDRRVNREAKTLVDSGYSVDLVCIKDKNLPEKELIDGINVLRWLNEDIFDIKKRNCFDNYAKYINDNLEFDIIHANDHTMLHLGSKLKKINSNYILIYDSHELFHCWPLNISNFNSLTILIKSFLVRKYQIIREKRNRKYIDYIITVNQSLAADLSNYLFAKKEITVVRNIPEKTNSIQKTNILREKFNISGITKILVFIGANIYKKTLNIEHAIDEFGNKENTAFVIICKDNLNSKPVKEYVKEHHFDNIFFHDIIHPSEISQYLSSADVGLVPTWNKKDLSYWYALDNKLFEYINANIPVLATQQPEYVNIVKKYQCGICVNPDHKNAYIDGFKEILEKYEYFRNNTVSASQDLIWENEEQKLIDLYKKINDE